MNEIKIRQELIKSNLLYKWFGNEGIIDIEKEYNLGNNKRIDLFLETELSYKLIENKISLNSYDIGQIVTYSYLFSQLKKDKPFDIYLLFKYNESKISFTMSIINQHSLKINLIDFKNQKIYNYADFKLCHDAKNKNKLNIKSIEPKTIPITKKELNFKNIDAYLKYCKLNMQNNNIIPGYKKIGRKIGITQGESLRIYKYLIRNNYIYKNATSKRTYLKTFILSK